MLSGSAPSPVAAGQPMAKKDDEQHRARRHGSQQVECETSRPYPVGENQKQRSGEQRPEREQRDERCATEVLTGVGLHRVSLLERPVSELGGHEESRCEKWGAPVERRVVDCELRPVQAAQQEK